MKIGVIGTGYVGLTIGLCLAHQGHDIYCVDIDKKKIEDLRNNKLPIYEKNMEEFLKKTKNNISFDTNLEKIIKEQNLEAIYIAVGTPSRPDKRAELKYVKNVAREIGKHINKYTLIINKSTVPVGTSRMVKKTINENYKSDIDVVSNPEFLKEGSAIDDFLNSDRFVIGYETDKSKKIIEQIYKVNLENNTPFLWTNPESAELIKYASNATLAICISFVNYLTQIYPEHNVYEMTEIMKKKINSKAFFNTSPGFGGSCFPKDVNELLSFLNEYQVNNELLKDTLKINEFQKIRIVNELEKKIIPGNTIGILGLSFKPGTDDVRESSSLEIIKKLNKKGYHIQAHDPKAIENAKLELNLKNIDYTSTVYSTLFGSQALLILTDWPEFKYMRKSKELFLQMKEPRLVYDQRRLLMNSEVVKPNKIVKLNYHGLGLGKKRFSEQEKKAIIKKFKKTMLTYKSMIEKLCSKTNANIDDVVKGMEMDKRLTNLFTGDY